MRLREAGAGMVALRRIVTALAGSAAMMTLFLGLGGGAPAMAEPSLKSLKDVARLDQAMPVETATVRHETSYVTSAAYAGVLAARRESALGFEQGGLIAEILVEEGDVVEAGQVLAKRDIRRLEAQRSELEANLDAAKARLALAVSTLRRQRELVRRNNASEQRLDEAAAERNSAAAAVAQAEAGLQAVEVQLDLAVLKAPFDAVVVARAADEGTIAAPGQTILRVLERAALEARIGVPPVVAERLESGPRARTLSVGGQSVSAVLRTVLPEVDAQTRTVLAIFDLDPSAEERLKAGSIARIGLETAVQERGFWIPVAALSEARRGLWSAFAVVPPEGGAEQGTAGDGTAGGGAVGVAERRLVTVLHTETDRAYVRGTFKDGDTVITGGVHKIVPGQAVRAVPAAAQ